MSIGDWVATYGAVLATITAVWTVWREMRDRHRFQMHLGVVEIRGLDEPTEIDESVLGGSVTNVGTRTAYVKSLGPLLKSGRMLFTLFDPRIPNHYLMPQLPCELAPGQSCDFRLPLNQVTSADVEAFVAYDSHNKEWRAPDKLFREVVRSANESIGGIRPNTSKQLPRAPT
jgi:hypothetical protein